MHNVLDKIDKSNFKAYDLDKEFDEALKDESFKQIVSKLKLDRSYLKKYTSILEECSREYSNCKGCKNILECKNKIEGFVYLPGVVEGVLEFAYKPCKYKKTLIKKNEYMDNVKYFSVPEAIKKANIKDIYKTDKNRFEVINWLLDFVDNYKTDKKDKGLYLHGNFGCGKTYLISAIFNELASFGYKSSIIFWPEFLRQAFYDDFNSKFEYVKKVPLLLIDDIGAEGLTAWNRDEILCPLLQYRMDNNLTTFFTSNLNIKELETHLSNSKNSVDEIKAGRIISRIKQLTHDIEMLSKNLRN